MVGFHEPHLITFMNELGLTVDCIIKLQSDEYVHEDPKEYLEASKPGALLAADKTDGKSMTSNRILWHVI